ncbi:Zinc finger DNA binding protein [Operophtera brumata]|uniref:Zinc finger DNA binding protein n=1 Tax=Operophtera brumata TaxID=104452 RepID=A0A0L7KMZ2_OPEBR|nr:Zinc finger DNA binding protein [Operophtera brumata]
MQCSMDELRKNINEDVKLELSRLADTTGSIISELHNLRVEYSDIKESVTSLRTQQQASTGIITDLQDSVEHACDQVEATKKRMDKIEKQLSSEDLHSELASLKHSLKSLQVDSVKQQQRDRMFKVEITGLPESKSEDLEHILISIAMYARVSITCNDISHINRVQPMKSVPGRPRAIVAKLHSRLHKDNIIAGVRKHRGISTKDLSLPGEARALYVNEHLTPHNKELLKKCKDVAKTKQYQFVWVKNCQIFMRKHYKAPLVTIRVGDDIAKLL